MLRIAHTMTSESGSNPVSCNSDANVFVEDLMSDTQQEQKREWCTHPFRLSLLLQPNGRQRQVFEKSCKLSVCTDLFHYDFTSGFVFVCTFLLAILLGSLDTCDDVLMLSIASRRLQLACLIVHSPD